MHERFTLYFTEVQIIIWCMECNYSTTFNWNLELLQVLLHPLALELHAPCDVKETRIKMRAS